MSLPIEITALIERFERNRESYLSGYYNETQLRREFLDPFFTALGWDVDNKQGYAEAYKDVIHEDALKIGGVTKAPDYCFRIGGVKKFFVEAKKPSVNLKEDISPAFQLRRYAWSAKLPLSILTDFEEFAVYDCRIKPSQTDKASTGRVLYLTYKDYQAKWEELFSIFSREAILKGSFDKYADSSKLKKGTATVDSAFLSEIEEWRDILARNIALRNVDLSQRELNFSVQRTIDRIVFLRICEDRGIEEYGRLQMQLNGTNVYRRLLQLFTQADDRYNSGLFHFQQEKDRHEEPDNLTTNISIDDKPLKDIIRRLYYPESPYEFSVLSADILGQVYEQFLGKVIRLTAGHQARVEEKPEVRKAGGVYYTPTHIVDYIVKNTVGKLIEGKKPKEVERLKILDPACGSGSFLLGTYQHLLDWHLKWYIDHDPEKWAKARQPTVYQGPSPDPRSPNWHLTTTEKKRILLNNIYGVDIDSQAVEVTKLSLLLKVLEGENNQTLAAELRLFHKRALPDLGDNIKCGNSLIGPDFYQQQMLLDDEERYRINVFDWEKEFPAIMKAGGFDAVIGNPPYGASFGDLENEYFKNNYEVFGGVKDVYTCFIERSLTLLSKNGRHAFIVPSAWLGGPEYKQLREHILSHQIDSIILLPFDVFKDAYVDTTVFVITNHPAMDGHKVQTHIYPKKEKLRTIDLTNDFKSIPQRDWMRSVDKKFVLDPVTVHLLEKIRKQVPTTFDNVIQIKRGVLFDKSLLTLENTGLNSYKYFEGDVYRYQLNLVADQWIEFDDKMKERPKEFIWFDGTRILLRRLVNRRQRLMAALTNDTFITNKNLYSVLTKDTSVNIHAILGVINSRLISYLYINQVTQATKDDFPQVTIKDVLGLPFPSLSEKKGCYDKLASLVGQMLSLNERLPKLKTDHEKTSLQRQIEAVDRQIDQLVYELYGLTEEEIRIVEGR
jgi:type I restriction-modification system DNA methylase subunit